jgi:hypothetical protein
MNLDYVNEIGTVHEVKVALCYLLARVDGKIPERDLYRIIFDIEFVNYFLYTSAIEELIIHKTIFRENIDGTEYILLGDKGREAAEVLKKNVQFRFRKHLLEAAYRYTAERSSERAAKVSISKRESGYSVKAIFGDEKLELMNIDLYAPDEDQAEYLAFQIREDPIEFYKTVINSLLFAKRPEIKIDEDKV